MSAELARYCGIIAFCIYWLNILYLLRKKDYKLNQSLSSYLAEDTRRLMHFAVVVTFETTLYAAFFYRWLIPTFKLDGSFTVLAAIGLICHILTAWIPSTTGVIKRLHWIVSYSTALVFLPAAVMLGSHQVVPFTLRCAALFSAAIMCSIIYISLRHSWSGRQYKLPLHLAYIASFQCVWLLIAIFD